MKLMYNPKVVLICFALLYANYGVTAHLLKFKIDYLIFKDQTQWKDTTINIRFAKDTTVILKKLNGNNLYLDISVQEFLFVDGNLYKAVGTLSFGDFKTEFKGINGNTGVADSMCRTIDWNSVVSLIQVDRLKAQFCLKFELDTQSISVISGLQNPIAYVLKIKGVRIKSKNLTQELSSKKRVDVFNHFEPFTFLNKCGVQLYAQIGYSEGEPYLCIMVKEDLNNELAPHYLVMLEPLKNRVVNWEEIEIPMRTKELYMEKLIFKPRKLKKLARL